MPESSSLTYNQPEGTSRGTSAQRTKKLGIVGAGHVATTVAYAALIRGVAKNISLYDPTRSRATAEALDLNHGLMFVPMANVEGSDDVQVLAGSDIVVFTAGTSFSTGQTRMDLAASNAKICRDVLPKILAVAPGAFLLMVSNPVDVLTQVAITITGHNPSSIFGSGTVLDSSRFRFLLAQHFGASVQSVHAYITGEHGDSEIPLWSSANIGNVQIDKWNVKGHGRPLTDSEKNAFFTEVRQAGYQVLAGKGATNFAIGLATISIIEAIFHDEGRVLPVSSLIPDYCGISGVCLSLPAIINRCGVDGVIPLPLSDLEQAGLKTSAERIRSVVHSIVY